MSIEIVKIDTVEDLKEYVKTVTAKRRSEKFDEEVAAVAGDSPLVKAIRENCENVDRDLRPIFSAIVKAVEGRDVAFKDEDADVYDYPRFSAIVPLNNPNGHTYAIGKAFIVDTKKDGGKAYGGVREDETRGNNHGGKWRYATDIEIDELFETLTDKVLKLF